MLICLYDIFLQKTGKYLKARDFVLFISVFSEPGSVNLCGTRNEFLQLWIKDTGCFWCSLQKVHCIGEGKAQIPILAGPIITLGNSLNLKFYLSNISFYYSMFTLKRKLCGSARPQDYLGEKMSKTRVFWGGGCNCCIWKFWGQGSNSCHSSDLSHCGDNARSLTCWATREFQEAHCLCVLRCWL